MGVWSVAGFAGPGEGLGDPVKDQEAARLLADLSDGLWTRNMESVKRMPAVEAKLVAMGTAALPVLERELRLGINSLALDAMQRTGQSHRWAAVTVLAQIPGEKSTDLLYRSLFDPPDNMAMRSFALKGLKGRALTDERIVGLLKHPETSVVLAGIEKAAGQPGSPDVRATLDWLTQKGVLEVQFKNRNGASISSKESRWEVRLAAGLALGRDMTDDKRARAEQILQSLQAAAEALSETDQPKPNRSAGDREWEIGRGLDGLSSLGQVITAVVDRAAGSAGTNFAVVLDMANARLGKAESVRRVTGLMNEASNPSIRYCAAVTVRRLRNPAAKAALWKALEDPYHRPMSRGEDVGPRREVYPVRRVAADALIELGEDPQQVRAAQRRGEVKEAQDGPSRKGPVGGSDGSAKGR